MAWPDGEWIADAPTPRHGRPTGGQRRHRLLSVGTQWLAVPLPVTAAEGAAEPVVQRAAGVLGGVGDRVILRSPARPQDRTPFRSPRAHAARGLCQRSGWQRLMTSGAPRRAGIVESLAGLFPPPAASWPHSVVRDVERSSGWGACLSAAPHAPKERCHGPGKSERQHETSGGRTPARRWRDRLAQRRRAAGHLHDPEHPTRPARLPLLDLHLAALAPHDGLRASRGVGVVGTRRDAPSPAPQGAPPSRRD
jgi:hypothetical protein